MHPSKWVRPTWVMNEFVTAHWKHPSSLTSRNGPLWSSQTLNQSFIFQSSIFPRQKYTHSVCPINQSELLKHCASLDLLLGGRWGDVDVEVDDDGLIKDAKLWSLLATCKLAFSPSPDCFFFLVPFNYPGQQQQQQNCGSAELKDHVPFST